MNAGSGPAAGVPPSHEVARDADEAFARMLARDGLPSLAEYRRVYESFGIPWPGDDEVRRLHPVDPASPD